MKKLSEKLADKFDPENPKNIPIHHMGDIGNYNQPTQPLGVREVLLHQSSPTNKSFSDFWFLQSEWSQMTFGMDKQRGPAGPLEHLAKEVQELREDPTDIMEYIDCIFLVIDAARRQGYSFYDVMDGLFLKLKQNTMRQWNKPSTDRPVEHVRKGQKRK